jgi:peptidoglycan/xylan/chitin deacetylase (PgdA/CDA1 family)
MLRTLLNVGTTGLRAYRRGDSVLNVLTFHRVLQKVDPLQLDWPCVDEFRRRLVWLQSVSSVLPLPEALDAVFINKTPGVFSSITFDDGYLDNHQIALPVLESLGLKATFFISTAYLSGGLMFNDLVRETIRALAIPRVSIASMGIYDAPCLSNQEKLLLCRRINQILKYMPVDERDAGALHIADVLGFQSKPNLMMNSDHLRDMSKRGMCIGSHSHRHVIANTVSLNTFVDDVALSKTTLTQLVDQPITLFAFPNGKPEKDFSAAHQGSLRELGFRAAFSTENGSITRSRSLFDLPRFSPWSKSHTRSYLQLSRMSRAALARST